ncbi:helix-turn-helix domain-containing protein [Microbacterium horticulturae]|uniref:helix-turn-helix domain-containing protein n=1 Tax=Microbacterium horticulturae TaxID=3028316 RepID=UPI003D170062
MIDDDKRAIILARREKGESIRVIARVLDVSVGTVHGVLAEGDAATEPANDCPPTTIG